MKFLISENFKALRSGEYVTASEDDGEFILDSNEAEAYTIATLNEISLANGFKASKEKRNIVLEKLTQNLLNLGLPTMNDKTDTQKVAEIVAAGVEAGKTDDEMLIEILSSGIKFKAAGKLFNAAMTEGGYRITAKKRKEECRAILVEAEFQPETYEELEKMLEHLSQNVADTETNQAYSIVRAYAKEFEIELPKPVKAPKGGLLQRALEWMVANPEGSDDDLAAWIEEQGKEDPEGKLLSKFSKYYAFGKAMRAAEVA